MPRQSKPSPPSARTGRAPHTPSSNTPDSAPDAHSQTSPADTTSPQSAMASPNARQTSSPHMKPPPPPPAHPSARPPPQACPSATGQTTPPPRRRRHPCRRGRWFGRRCYETRSCRMNPWRMIGESICSRLKHDNGLRSIAIRDDKIRTPHPDPRPRPRRAREREWSRKHARLDGECNGLLTTITSDLPVICSLIPGQPVEAISPPRSRWRGPFILEVGWPRLTLSVARSYGLT